MTTITEPILKPFVRRAALENSRWFGGHLFSFLATSEDTGGQFAFMEVQLVAGQEPPPHTHALDDEAFFVLEGSIAFRLGNQATVAHAGEFVLLPRGVEHRFQVIGPTARALLISAPGGLEQAFYSLSTPAEDMTINPTTAHPDIPRFISEFEKQGIVFSAPGDATGSATANPWLVSRRALGLSRWYNNSLMTILAKGAKTHGNFSLIEFSMRRSLGPPLHVHSREDEAIYLLEGEADFVCGDESFTLSSGELIFLPRGIPHTFRITSEHARALTLITPAGFENFFEDLSLPAPALVMPPLFVPKEKDIAALISVSRKHATQIVGPAL